MFIYHTKKVKSHCILTLKLLKYFPFCWFSHICKHPYIVSFVFFCCFFPGRNMWHLLVLELKESNKYIYSVERSGSPTLSLRLYKCSWKRLWIRQKDRLWFVHMQLALLHATFTDPCVRKIISSWKLPVSCGSLLRMLKLRFSLLPPSFSYSEIPLMKPT